MLKNSFKQFLKFILVMVFSSLLATSASSATIDETGAIIDNNTFATAHTMGYWQFPSHIHPSDKNNKLQNQQLQLI